jgi:hypothetical protein
VKILLLIIPLLFIGCSKQEIIYVDSNTGKVTNKVFNTLYSSTKIGE